MHSVRSLSVFFCLCSVIFLQAGEAAAADLLSLSEGLRIVAEKSRSIRISRSDEQIAEAETQMVMARLLPTVNAAAAWTSLAYQPTAIFGRQTVPVADSNFLAYSFTVQQTLFDFRGSASRYDASKALLSAVQLDTARIRNLAAIEFVMSYLNLLEQEKIISVAEKEVEAMEAHRNDARSLFEEGVITKNDLLQAEVKISDSRQRLLTARAVRTVHISGLNSLLLKPLLSELRVVDIGELTTESLPQLSTEAAWAVAEEQRAELRIADETLKALGFEEKARESEFYPRLFAKGGYDYTANRYQLHEGNWSVIVGLNFNLFSGGSTRAELKKIDSQRDKLLEQRKKLVDDIRLEVQRYLLLSITAQERLSVTKDAVLQAEENLRINRVKYEEGIGTGTDVLDAVSLLTVASTNYYKALYDLRKYEAAVLYAVGKDLLEVYR